MFEEMAASMKEMMKNFRENQDEYLDGIQRVVQSLSRRRRINTINQADEEEEEYDEEEEEVDEEEEVTEDLTTASREAEQQKDENLHKIMPYAIAAPRTSI